MTKSMQIRDVPEDVHRTLKERAARAGMSLSDYLLRIVTEEAMSPTLDAVLDRLGRGDDADTTTTHPHRISGVDAA